MTRKQTIKPGNTQITYSRSPNLKAILVKATLTRLHRPQGNMKSKKIRCKTCFHLQETAWISSNDQILKLRETFNCQRFGLCNNIQSMQQQIQR